MNSYEDLEAYRDYLRMIARNFDLDPALRPRMDLSGVVQTTLLEAHQASDRWATMHEDARLAWLRRILKNNLNDEIRKNRAGMRDVYFEGNIDKGVPLTGQVAGRIEAVRPVADIIGDMVEEFEEVVGNMGRQYAGLS